MACPAHYACQKFRFDVWWELAGLLAHKKAAKTLAKLFRLQPSLSSLHFVNETCEKCIKLLQNLEFLQTPFCTTRVDKGGTILQKLNGKLHGCYQQAAVHTPSGTKKRYWYGKKHCSTGPACTYKRDGAKKDGYEYWLHGVMSRRGGLPAAENSDRFEFVYKVDGKYHRIGGPAYRKHDGEEGWLIDGKYSRDDGAPAHYGGTLQHPLYYLDGVLHNENGPAKVVGQVRSEPANPLWWTDVVRYAAELAHYYSDREEHYLVHGEYHCEFGPARILSATNYAYYVNGVEHRVGGPQSVSGSDYVYRQNGKVHRDDGTDLPAQKTGDLLEWKVNGEWHRLGGKPAVYLPGVKELYYEHGKLHRLNGPAEMRCGFHTAGGRKNSALSVDCLTTKRWMVRGQPCRDDHRLPCVTKTDSDGVCLYKEFRKNGKLHAPEGEPAIEERDRKGEIIMCCFAIDGVYHNPNGPAFVDKQAGVEMWLLHGKKHRIGGPALIKRDGSKYYYENDELHRIGAPAVYTPDGTTACYVRGKKVFSSFLFRDRQCGGCFSRYRKFDTEDTF